jgi:hypothetical protein
VDLTATQYPEVPEQNDVIVQEKGAMDGYPLVHITSKVSRLDEYNVAQFSGRLSIFAEAIGIELPN